MYYNNLNRQREEEDDDDLKFIPLNIKEPFKDKDSNWLPIVNMNSPNINHMTNNFILGLSNQSDSEMLDQNFLKKIDYVPNVNYSYTDENDFNTYDTGNLSNNMLGNNYNNQVPPQGSGYLPSNMLTNSYNDGMSNQNATNFNNNFNLEYPSENQAEFLYSYDKEKNCNGYNSNYSNYYNSQTGEFNEGYNNNMENMNTGFTGMNGNMENINTGFTGMNGNMWNMNTGVTGMNNNMWNMNTGVTGMNSNMWNMNTGVTGMNNNMWNMNTGVTGMNNNMWNMNTGVTGMNNNMGNMNTGVTGMNNNMGNMDGDISNIWDDNYEGSINQQYVPFTNFNSYNLSPNELNTNPSNMFPSGTNINQNNQFTEGTNEYMNNAFTGEISGGTTNAMPNKMDIDYNDAEPNYILTNVTNMNPLNMAPSYTIPEDLEFNGTTSQINTVTASNPKIDDSYNSFEKLDDYMKTHEKTGVTRGDEEGEEPPHMEILRELDLGSEYESIYRNEKSKEIDGIFNKIEENHGAIISTLKAYRIPYPIISLLVKKIIKITLEHSNKE